MVGGYGRQWCSRRNRKRTKEVGRGCKESQENDDDEEKKRRRTGGMTENDDMYDGWMDDG